MTTKLDRSDIRRKALDVRNALSPEHREMASLNISEHVLSHPKIKRANYIFIYLSYQTEVDTWALAQEFLDRGIRICVPLITGPGAMEARRINHLKGDIEIGPMGISSPLSFTEPVDPRLIDIILAPGLWFDTGGTRIGYGGGYYDRFLKQVRSTIEVWGLCFDEQVSASKVERNPWDHPVTGLFTPSGFINTKS